MTIIAAFLIGSILTNAIAITTVHIANNQKATYHVDDSDGCYVYASKGSTVTQDENGSIHISNSNTSGSVHVEAMVSGSPHVEVLINGSDENIIDQIEEINK
jgi:hypothetical protein